MTIRDALKKTRKIQIFEDTPMVAKTVAEEFKGIFPEIQIEVVKKANTNENGVFSIAIGSIGDLKKRGIDFFKTDKENFVFCKIDEQGAGVLACSHQQFLYGYASNLLDDELDKSLEPFLKGKLTEPAFKWQRSCYDYFLTQPGRIQKNLNRETYIKQMAKFGFTHIEVNGLAYPMALETGPEGETYPMFYTYCPALDQFVYSDLNKGLYPYYYLSANFKYLKENAELAKKYGMIPGLLSFEPRSVPERFFEKYPMLRGARVDHPFRSFKPRYNMTTTHPKVLAHYAEMLKKILKEVPEIEFFSIWTSDSGAGFEYVKSLYVGRNGGAYLIREWKTDEEIARQAGENVLRFYRTLAQAGKEINPNFRVITRLEPFYGEHDTIWDGLGEGIDVEGTSLAAKGWAMPYSHPKYPDNHDINGGTVYQLQFDEKEKQAIDELERKKALAHFYFSVGPHVMFDPMMGVPYPKLTFKRLKLLRENGVKSLAHHGGIFPPELVPYNINHEIVKKFQTEPDGNVDEFVAQLAKKWAGEKFAESLLKAWDLAEEAILAYPNVVPLYSTFGFSWYRLWARPFVPNFEAMPKQERAYYEDYSCTTPHNPNNVDLSRDVLFQLTDYEKSKKNLALIEENLWEPLNQAIEILEKAVESANQSLGKPNVIFDQLIRLKALRCWFMTNRNVAAWVVAVHGYLNGKNDDEKKKHLEIFQEMVDKEIENTRELEKLLDSGVEFMSMTDMGETPLIYGSNLKSLLPRRIELMEKHRYDEPYIDPDYIEKMAGMMMEEGSY